MKYVVFLCIMFGAKIASAQVVVAPTFDQSGIIAAGGTFQVGSSQTKSRRSIEFVNICSTSGACNATTDTCYLYFASTGLASETTNAIPVPAGWAYLRSTGTIPSDAIMVTCTATGDHYRLAVQ
jgi:hypothetical protein